MNNFKSGNAYKNITWVCLAIPSPIIDFPQTTLPIPRLAQSMTMGRLCPICILRLCWEWHIPKPSPLGWSPENLLHACHPPGARVKQGKTSAPSSPSLPLSCFKHILFPGITNQYLLFFSHHEHGLSPAGWIFWLTKQVLITPKLLYSSSWPGSLSLKEQP